MYEWSLGTLSRLMSLSWRFGMSESDVRADRVMINDSVNLIAWVRMPSFSESNKARTSPFIWVTRSQHASCLSDTVLERTNHWPEESRMEGNKRDQWWLIFVKNWTSRSIFTWSVTLYSWVSVRMAFFTTFTPSSFSNIFRLAIRRRRSSLSLLLYRRKPDERLNRGKYFSCYWNFESRNSPCFFNKANDKFSYFNRFVSLKGNHLLQKYELNI